MSQVYHLFAGCPGPQTRCSSSAMTPVFPDCGGLMTCGALIYWAT